MGIRRRLGAVALAVAVMVGGLLMTAGPAAACSCAIAGSEAERMARADAVFVGELIGSRVDSSALPRDTRRIPNPAPVVLTFKVSRVVKGAVSERQEIVTSGGGSAGCEDSGLGSAAWGRSWCSRTTRPVTCTGLDPVSTPRTCAVDHGR